MAPFFANFKHTTRRNVKKDTAAIAWLFPSRMYNSLLSGYSIEYIPFDRNSLTITEK